MKDLSFIPQWHRERNERATALRIAAVTILFAVFNLFILYLTLKEQSLLEELKNKLKNSSVMVLVPNKSEPTQVPKKVAVIKICKELSGYSPLKGGIDYMEVDESTAVLELSLFEEEEYPIFIKRIETESPFAIKELSPLQRRGSVVKFKIGLYYKPKGGGS